MERSYGLGEEIQGAGMSGGRRGLFPVLGLPTGNPPLQGGVTRGFRRRASTKGLSLRVKNPRLIGVSPKEHFVDPRPVDQLGFDLGLHAVVVGLKRDRTIAAPTVIVTRARTDSPFTSEELSSHRRAHSASYCAGASTRAWWL